MLPDDNILYLESDYLYGEKAPIKKFPRSDMIVCGNIAYAKTLDLFFQKSDVNVGKPIMSSGSSSS